MNLVAGGRLGVTGAWSFGFHFRSSIVATPDPKTPQHGEWQAKRQTSCWGASVGLGCPKVCCSLYASQAIWRDEGLLGKQPIRWSSHPDPNTHAEHKRSKRPPLLTHLYKVQSLGRHFLPFPLETHWFLSLIVRLFVECLVPSQAESQPFSACLNKQELSRAKTCCLSFGLQVWFLGMLDCC